MSFHFLDPRGGPGVDAIEPAQVSSVGATPQYRGAGKNYYSANLKTDATKRPYKNVPVLSPFVSGGFGMHIGVPPSAYCVVGYSGKHRQPYVLGFFNPRDDKGTYAGGRPALEPYDFIYNVPGMGKGTPFRAIYSTGIILDQASKYCSHFMDPTTDSIEQTCRSFSRLFPSGFERWKEKPAADRRNLYHRRIFQRASGSRLGPGAFVDEQIGTVPILEPGGTEKDPDDILLSLKSFNGNLVEKVGVDGDYFLESAGSMDVDLTRKGWTAAKIQGTEGVVTSFRDKKFVITANGIEREFTITNFGALAKAIAREINENHSEVIVTVRRVTLPGTGLPVDFLDIETRAKGEVTLTVSGNGAEALGWVIFPLTSESATGSVGTNGDQDITLQMSGQIQGSIGQKSDSRRAIELTMGDDAESVFDFDEDTKITVSPANKRIKFQLGDTDGVFTIEGKKASLEMNDGSLTFELDATGSPETCTVKCGKFKFEADQESELVVPSLKIGNADLADTLVETQKLIGALSTRIATYNGHTHPIPLAQAVSLFVTPSSLPPVPTMTIPETNELDSNVKVDTKA